MEDILFEGTGDFIVELDNSLTPGTIQAISFDGLYFLSDESGVSSSENISIF